MKFLHLKDVTFLPSFLLSVFFLYVYGGMDFAHSAGWNQTLNTTATQVFKCSWFIGVLAGAALASLTMTFLPKLLFYVSETITLYTHPIRILSRFLEV